MTTLKKLLGVVLCLPMILMIKTCLPPSGFTIVNFNSEFVFNIVGASGVFTILFILGIKLITGDNK